MNRKDIQFQTSDDHTLLGSEYLPEKPHQKTILVIHGMAEHHRRYDGLIKQLCEDNFKVYALDIRGHGLTGQNSGEHAYFSDQDGWERIVQDHQEIIEWILQENPNQNFYLFAHSMGSFIARCLISRPIGAKIHGAILSGTSGHPGPMGWVGLFIAKFMAATKGKKVDNPYLTNMVFNNYNKYFKPARTSQDWLNRDSYQVDLFIKDVLRLRVLKTQFLADLFSGVLKVNHRNTFASIKTPRIFLMAGKCDTVGNNGIGVTQVFRSMQAAGVPKVNMKLYPGARHEILLELNKEEVLSDLLGWINTAEKEDTLPRAADTVKTETVS